MPDVKWLRMIDKMKAPENTQTIPIIISRIFCGVISPEINKINHFKNIVLPKKLHWPMQHVFFTESSS